MITKDSIIASVINLEKGYVNDPDDRGGETNFGITIAVAKENEAFLRKNFKWDGTVRNLTKPMATAIYEKKYWAALKLDDVYNISPLLADKLFDISVNMGTKRAGMWLQQALNAFNRKAKDYKDIVADGVVGAKTIEALEHLIKIRGNKEATRNLLKALLSFQGVHYINVSLDNPDNETFTWGWYNRLDHNLEVYLDI